MTGRWPIKSNLANIPMFGGTIWYVNKGTGSDFNGGREPNDALGTIGAAINAMSDGDAINVKAGTYTEVGLDLSNAAAEIWFEIGVTLDPAAGTALTVSGAACRVKGAHTITPAAGAIGILVTGAECVVSNAKILTGATSIRVTGAGVILNECACGFPTVAAYDLRGAQGRLYRCKTVGNAATIGYWINTGADTGVLEECTSAGHTTSGYTIATGSQDWTVLRCSSGAGDGRWVDVDHANVWSGFSYADEIHSIITFAGIPTTYNIFQITGAVRIRNIYGIVTTPIAATPCTVYLQLVSAGTVDMTDAPGVDINAVVAGGLLVRNAPSSSNLDLANPNGAPVMAENVAWKDPTTAIDIVKDNGAATFVRLVLSAALASGAIDWHCDFTPLSDDGWLAAV